MTEPAAVQPPAGRELMSFMVAGQEYCVDVAVVRELRGWAETTPLPGAPEFVVGVTNLRGTVLPILDVTARLGLGRAEPTQRHVIVVVNIGRQQVGLLVDGVCEIVVAPLEVIQPTPDLRCNAVAGFLDGVVAFEGRMIGLLRVEQLLPAAEAQAA